MSEDFKNYSQEKKARIIAHHVVYAVIIHLMLAAAFLCGKAVSCDKGGNRR